MRRNPNINSSYLTPIEIKKRLLTARSDLLRKWTSGRKESMRLNKTPQEGKLFWIWHEIF